MVLFYNIITQQFLYTLRKIGITDEYHHKKLITRNLSKPIRDKKRKY